MKLRSVLILLLIAVSAIGFQPARPASAAPTTGPKSALIRFIHTASDAPALDLYLNDSKYAEFTQIKFGEYSITEEIPADKYDIVVREAGSAGDSKPLFSKKGVTFEAGTSNSLIAMGRFSGSDKDFDVKKLAHDRSVPDGKARVELIQGIPDLGTVDLSFGGKKALTNLKYLEFDTVDVAPGKSNGKVATSDGKTALFNLSNQTFEANTLYSVFLIGTAANPDNLIVPTSNDTGYVKFMNATADAPSLDFYINDFTVFSLQDFAYKGSTNYHELPAGKYTFTVRQAGAHPNSDPEAGVTDVTLEKGMSIIVITNGLFKGKDDQKLRLSAFPVDRSALNGKVRVQDANLLPDVPKIDFFQDGSRVDAMSDIGYGDSVTVNPIPPLTTTLGVAPAGDKEPSITYDKLDLNGDTIYSFFAVGTGADMHVMMVTSRPDVNASAK